MHTPIGHSVHNLLTTSVHNLMTLTVHEVLTLYTNYADNRYQQPLFRTRRRRGAEEYASHQGVRKVVVEL